MRKMLLGSILVCGLFALGGVEEAVGPGTTDRTLPNVPSRDTLLLDTRAAVDPPAFAVVSSNFTDIAGGFETMSADDFNVPDCGWELTRVRAYGGYSATIMGATAGPAASVNVYILPKTASLPTSTDVASIAVWFGEGLPYTELDAVNGGDFEIELPGVVLEQGDYWLVVQANHALLSNGQWNWTESSLTTNSGTTLGDESAWFQSMAGVASPISGVAECVGGWGARVSSCQMTRNPDTNPPADRDHAFQLEGNILTPAVVIDPTTVATIEDGSNASYSVWLSAPPTPGATVTVTPSSGDVTEGTVSSALNFTGANWDIPQMVTVTPGASGDGNDGDVMYSITHAVSSTAGGGCYDGVMAGSVSATNANIEGVATITVDPSTGLMVSEDGVTTATFTVAAVGSPTNDITVDLTINTPSEVTTSVASAVLTAGNSYSQTVTVTGVADDVVEDPQAFSITTEPAVSADVAYNGVDPSNVSGTVTDSNTASVTVTPNNDPVQTSETGTTDTIDYVLTAQPTADVSFNISTDDSNEATVSPSTLTFTMANWDTPQTVTVTGQNDDVDDGTTAYNVIATPTTSADDFWDGVNVDDVAGQNADDGDTAGITVNPLSVTTDETGTTDTFTVVLDSQPLFDVSLDVRSSDITEGLVSDDNVTFGETTTLTFTFSNWNTPQTVFVQGQDDDIRDDGDIVYTIVTENTTSGDAGYDGIAVADVTATNQDDADTAGLIVSPLTLDLDEDSAPTTFTVRLNSEPTSGTVQVPVTSGDTTEATVDTATLFFDSGNWNVDQMVTVTPVIDNEIDDDQNFDITVGPATGGNYAGLTETVNVTIRNIDVCGEMDLDAPLGGTIVAYGTETCEFDLYNTHGEPDPANWEYLGTFTIGAGGFVDTGIPVETDALYVTTIAGTFVILTATPVATVPTLGEWGMIAMVMLLAMAAMVMHRRRANA